MSATGGTITPKEDGSYTLTATAKNSRGKTVVTTQTVEVYPVLTAEFALPKTAHTDTAIVVDLKTENLGDSDVLWTIKKDGTIADIKTAITGELTNTGGTIQFAEKGIYGIVNISLVANARKI